MGHIVLMSGGWESTLCALLAPKGTPLLYIDYMQVYARQELRASARIASLLDAPFFIQKIDTVRPAVDGVYPNRNKLLLLKARQYGDVIWFGCRGRYTLFDRYGDSNRQFADEMEGRLGCTIKTPCVNMLKFQVKRKVMKALQSYIIFSSEGLS